MAHLASSDSTTRLEARNSLHIDPDDDEDEIMEQDPDGRFSRYKQIVGAGRFKTVYKAFDEKRGIDVAWSKIDAAQNSLTSEQCDSIVTEMSRGLDLDHPHVIKSYQCWEDAPNGCINTVTEYFTSGNLRDYRRRHKSLDIKAVKKWGRQILQGLAYLHQHTPPIVHGDLRPDKLYINGHSGEIKIGDLGLQVLVPKRFEPGVMPEGDLSNQYTRSVDIFAFGLVMLELVTLQRMDRGNLNWSELLETVADPAARNFIEKCLGDPENRPAAIDLLKDSFLLASPKPAPTDRSVSTGGGTNTAAGGGTGGGGIGNQSEAHSLAKARSDLEQRLEEGGGPTKIPRIMDDDRVDGSVEAGSVRGEDYLFQFSGKIRNGKLHFRLHMEYMSEEDAMEAGTSKTIDFVYDPEVDTPDEIAAEISSEFNLSETDRDICAAALKEWLAKETEQEENSN